MNLLVNYAQDRINYKFTNKLTCVYSIYYLAGKVVCLIYPSTVKWLLKLFYSERKKIIYLQYAINYER